MKPSIWLRKYKIKCKIIKNNLDFDTVSVRLSITEEVSNNDSLVKSLRRTFSFVEEFPSYPGGEEAKSEFFNKNMIYPEADKKNKIQGTVFVTFIVCSDGQIRNVDIIRGLRD